MNLHSKRFGGLDSAGRGVCCRFVWSGSFSNVLLHFPSGSSPAPLTCGADGLRLAALWTAATNFRHHAPTNFQDHATYQLQSENSAFSQTKHPITNFKHWLSSDDASACRKALRARSHTASVSWKSPSRLEAESRPRCGTSSRTISGTRVACAGTH